MKLGKSMAARLGVVCCIAVVMSACAPSRSVRVQPVDEVPGSSSSGRSGEPASAADEYVVVRGDTLFGIAFRHSLDYRDIARINRIAAPYTIYPGQRLQLGARAVAAQPRSDPARPRGASSRSTGAGLIAATEKPSSPVSGRNASPAPTPAVPASTSASGARPTAAAPAAANAQPTAPTSVVATKPPAPLPSGPVRWQWPASGALVSTFVAGDPTRQGIGIGGSNGQPVVAAGPGTVVYSGAGLIGYGELIIIKHSDEWLSAYGHNRKRLVAEGESVQAGQQVAEMGRSGASRDMLHFEIRRNGKPVDPRGLLPKR